MTGKAAGTRINTPSDGYRALVIDICLAAYRDDAIWFFDTPWGRLCLDYLGLRLEMLNTLEKRNGNGHDS